MEYTRNHISFISGIYLLHLSLFPFSTKQNLIYFYMTFLPWVHIYIFRPVFYTNVFYCLTYFDVLIHKPVGEKMKCNTSCSKCAITVLQLSNVSGSRAGSGFPSLGQQVGHNLSIQSQITYETLILHKQSVIIILESISKNNIWGLAPERPPASALGYFSFLYLSETFYFIFI